MKKRGEMNPWGPILVIAFIIFGSAIIFGLYKGGVFEGEAQQAVAETRQTETIKTVVEQSKGGNIATIGVSVRDLANNNIDTKLAVATYCIDDTGRFVIDGTTSSASADITGKTAINKVITCYAFSSTIQTLKPTVVTVTNEYEPIVIDAYTLANDGKIEFYSDTNTKNDNLGAVNITSVGADISQSLPKLRITNNATDKILPLGGVYVDRVTGSNASKVEMAGSATLLGVNAGNIQTAHNSVQLVDSGLATRVSARTDLWDFVFEFDDAGNTKISPGDANKVLLLEESDYLETGSVTVTGDGDGCDAGGVDQLTPYIFTKGYFRLTKGTGIGYGPETDASSASSISQDIAGWGIFCTS